MDESILLALYSGMVVVVSFLGGFVFVSGMGVLRRAGFFLGTMKGLLAVGRVEKGSVEVAKESVGVMEKGIKETEREMVGVFAAVVIGLILLLFLMMWVGVEGLENLVYVAWIVFVFEIAVLAYVVRDLVGEQAVEAELNRRLELFGRERKGDGEVGVTRKLDEYLH